MTDKEKRAGEAPVKLSFRASRFIRKSFKNKVFPDREGELKRLEEERKTPEKPYVLQKHFRFRCDYTVKKECGMQVYYLNSSHASNLAVYFVHGGAYIGHPAKNQWAFVDGIAKKLNAEIVAPIYPLAPHHTYNEAYDMLMAQYALWRKANPTKRVIFMGDSAGGGLVLGMAQRLRDKQSELPEKMVLLSPWVDLTLNNPDVAAYEPNDPLLSVGFLKADAEFWAGDTDVADGKVSTLNADMTGLPETLIVQGTADIFYPDVMLLERKMNRSGVPVKTHIGENLPHVYLIFPFREAKEAREAVCEFCR